MAEGHGGLANMAAIAAIASAVIGWMAWQYPRSPASPKGQSNDAPGLATKSGPDAPDSFNRSSRRVVKTLKAASGTVSVQAPPIKAPKSFSDGAVPLKWVSKMQDGRSYVEKNRALSRNQVGKYLLDLIEENKRGSYTQTVRNLSDNNIDRGSYTYQMADPVLSVDSCDLRYHRELLLNGEHYKDSNVKMDMKTVDSILIQTGEEQKIAEEAASGVRVEAHDVPEVYMVTMEESGHGPRSIYFRNKNSAYNAAAVLVRFANLCHEKG